MKYLLLAAAMLSTAAIAEQVGDTGADNAALEQRLADERETYDNPFVITAHKPTYILLGNYNDKLSAENYANYGELQDVEIKFQFSFKMPVWSAQSQYGPSLLFAYSQVSYWQAYNKAESSPFRETNYEPEAFLSWRPNYQLGAGWSVQVAQIGFVHQSNGRSEPLSRSWNRVKASVTLERGNLGLALVPWLRIPEDREEDNNYDIIDYLGHGKILAAYKWHDHTFSMMSRNNLESGFSKGAIEGSWSFPLTSRVKGYVQFFSGYGNNLIEYNQYNNTVGIGIALTDWL
ncbi:phospholipase A [Motilimonas cestriensis]|uniref:phospholipase A n=1 Tax=Motilimonas cestriensis TaxID=2742685 RepID=UPI003DA28522